jgi:transposase
MRQCGAHRVRVPAPSVRNAAAEPDPSRAGRPRQRPAALAGDKAYSFPRLRRWLRARHVRPVIPERRDQQDRRQHRPGRRPEFDRAAYRQRNVIERAVGWLKERRRIATRYEKLAIQIWRCSTSA